MEQIAPGICVWDGFYSEAEGLLDKIKIVGDMDPSVAPWKRSLVYGPKEGTRNVVSDHRTSVEMDFHEILGDRLQYANDSHVVDLRNHLSDLINAYEVQIHNYRSAFNLKLQRNQGLRCLRYANKAEYQMHADASSTNMRLLSLLLYLNDDYVGGELAVPLFDVEIKPTAGTLVLMPACFPYSHKALPVEEGEKYVLVTWFQ
jgi:hypothetical protein